MLAEVFMRFLLFITGSHRFYYTNSNVNHPEVRLRKVLAFAKHFIRRRCAARKKGCVRLRKRLRKMKFFVSDGILRLRKVARFEGNGCARFADFF